MEYFCNKVKEICKEHEKVAMFVDMDGTVVEFTVYPEGYINKDLKGAFIDANPARYIIDVIEKLSNIKNLDIYILSLATTTNIYNEKLVWLEKYMPFLNKDYYIILNKEKGEYTSENRDVIKTQKMEEKLTKYDFEIFLDDDHKILKEALKELKDKIRVFHPSSVLV